MPSPHCSLCGCSAAHPCKSNGRRLHPDDAAQSAEPGAVVIFHCTRPRAAASTLNSQPSTDAAAASPARTCTHCRTCALCGDPLVPVSHAMKTEVPWMDPQLIVVAKKKHRLCAHCAFAPSGSAAWDRLIEAYALACDPTDPAPLRAAIHACHRAHPDLLFNS